jgi:IrrE N-terminal-like domain
VIALVEDYGRRADRSLVIRERARQLVERGRQFGWTGTPFDPRELASFLGIRLRPDRLAPGHDAFIVPRPGQQLGIIFDKSQPETRQNFSISHEICHTLFPDGYEVVRNRYEHRESFDPDRELEQLCDIGAAEILLPERDFRTDIARVGFGLGAVPVLRDRYQASREAIIRRMVQLHDAASVAVFLEYRLKPSEKAALPQLSLITSDAEIRPKLRIAYTVASPHFSVFLPPDKSVPDTSCVYRAALEPGTVSAVEDWGIRALPPCRVEAISLPTGDSPESPARVVALLQP